MDPLLIADSLVNLCGAIGLAVAILIFRARDPHGPLTRRFTFALGLVALVFLARGIGWLTGLALLDRLAVAVAAVIPLGALLVTEGILRRHGPRTLKYGVLAGTAVLAPAGLVAPGALDGRLEAALALFQLATFAACGLLLFTRDRDGLSSAENRGITRLAIAAISVLPFILSDFRAFLPAVPVRAGALGALLVVTFALVADSASEARRGHAAALALRIAAGLLLGLALSRLAPGAGAAETVRFAAVALAGTLVTGLLVDTTRAFFAVRSPGLLDRIARAGAPSRGELIAELSRHPPFAGARRLSEAMLADFDPPILRMALADRHVIRRADRPWSRPQDDPATERLAALMASHGASHILVVGRTPLDLISLDVPLVMASRATETALQLATRLIAASPEASP
jgi:hypothetical protein